MKKTIFTGAATAIVTPMTAEGVDYEQFGRLIEWQIAAFVAFRVFDIVKLPPASWCDRNLKNGWGIMIDDALAALYAIGVLAAAQSYFA